MIFASPEVIDPETVKFHVWLIYYMITFNPTKSKLLCFNACDAVTPQKLNGQPVSVYLFILFASYT